MYWSIRDVSNMLGCSLSGLRFWEQEFGIVVPRKGRKGIDRSYGKDEVELFRQIHNLVNVEQYTIKGAKRQLELRRSSEDELSGFFLDQDTSRRPTLRYIQEAFPV